MESTLSIENVTTGLLTLQKIRQLYKKDQRSNDDEPSSYVLPDRLSLIREILTSVTDLIPQTRGGTFSNAFEQGTRFSGAYRELKRHVGNMNRSSPGNEDIFRTLKLIIPVLDMRHKVYLDKVIKIVDILKA